MWLRSDGTAMTAGVDSLVQSSPKGNGGAPQPTPQAAPPTPQPTQPAPQATATQHTLSPADNIKQAVANKNSAVGRVIETLDSYGFDVGHTHVSLWTGSVVLLVIVGVIVFARFGSRLAHRILGKLTRLDLTQQLLAEKLITVAVWALAILVGIDVLGIDLTALTVFSGAFGLAIGFGLQKTFGNLIAGIILLMDRSIKPGDVISVADASGKDSFGQIRKIGIRAISVITRDRTEYLIPNENLMINQVVNWSYSSRDVRVKAPVGVSYNTDLDLAEKLMMQAAKDVPRVLDFPEPRVLLIEFGNSSVNFEIRFWIDDPEDGLSNIRSDVLKRVWDLFKQNGIEIPFPQRDLNLRDNKQFQELLTALSQRSEGQK
jgi:small-conductance mechanosensitive channel